MGQALGVGLAGERRGPGRREGCAPGCWLGRGRLPCGRWLSRGRLLSGRLLSGRRLPRRWLAVAGLLLAVRLLSGLLLVLLLARKDESNA